MKKLPIFAKLLEIIPRSMLSSKLFEFLRYLYPFQRYSKFLFSSFFNSVCLLDNLFLRNYSDYWTFYAFSRMGSGFPLPSGGFILVLKWLVVEENSSTLMIIYLTIIQVSNDGKCRYNEETAASGRQIPPRQLDSLLHTGRTQTPVLLSGTSAPICVRTVKLKNCTVKSGKFIILLAFNNFLLKILFS